MAAKTVQLRKAQSDDALRVLEWRNDPLTRAMSRTTDVIEEAGHVAWFAKAVIDPRRAIYIGAHEGRDIGMVRFDHGDDKTEVSIMLAPAARGKGLAKPLLQQAFVEVAHRPLYAEIKAGNAASLHLFSSVGFKQIGEKEDLTLWQYKETINSS